MWAYPRSTRQREPRYPEDFEVIWRPAWDSPSLLSDCHQASSLSDVCAETYETILNHNRGHMAAMRRHKVRPQRKRVA